VVLRRSADQTEQGCPQRRLSSRCRTVALTAGIAIGFLAAAVPAAEGDPSSPFAAISGSVDAGIDGGTTTTAAGFAVPSSHQNVVVSLSQTGSSQLGLDSNGGSADVGSGDVVWTGGSSLEAGDTPSVTATNDDEANGATFSANFFDEPTAPISYSGVSSTASDDSQLLFLTPGTAPYVASVTVSGGAVRVTGPAASQTFESSGQISLGTLSSGSGDVTVAPVDGPQTLWSVSISPEPIQIAGQQFNHVWSQPGIVNTLHYSVDGDTHITAQIENASGTVVRTLASGLFEGAGTHTLVWDGRDSSGNPVPTGTYTAKLTSDDPVGNVATASGTIGIDSTPPTVTLAHKTLRPSQAVIVRFADQGSGVATGSITVDGTHKQILRQGETTLSYGPRRWAPGRHQGVAVATDRAGTRTARTLSFRVKGNGVYVNCLPSRGLRWTRSAHPRSCDLIGQPEDEANLVLLRQAKWSHWGARTTTGRGRSLNTHPGMGGPASLPVTVSLYRITTGCGGDEFYTREKVTTRYGSGVLQLNPGCRQRL
jgi:hypothetical protein